jgi:hypothetical protein
LGAYQHRQVAKFHIGGFDGAKILHIKLYRATPKSDHFGHVEFRIFSRLVAYALTARLLWSLGMGRGWQDVRWYTDTASGAKQEMEGLAALKTEGYCVSLCALKHTVSGANRILT